MFHYVKKQAIFLAFNKLRKVDPSHINHNKSKELKKPQRWTTINGKRLYPICITGNKLNMWAEREVEEAFLQRFLH